MSELHVEGRPGSPAGPALFLLSGLALVAVAVAEDSPSLAVGALPLLLVGTALALTRPSTVDLTLTDTGVEVRRPEPESLAFAELEGVATGKTNDPWHDQNYPVHILKAGGVLTLPERLNVPSSSVYNFVADRLPGQGSARVPPDLREYYERHRADFGDERVWSFGARSELPRTSRGRGLLVMGLLFVSALVWIAVGVEGREYRGWGAGGAALLLFSVVGLLILLGVTQNPNRQVSDRRDSGLVVTPVGLALVQGDLRGEMRWDELSRMEYEPQRAGLILFFPGGRVRLADIYDRPLPEIRRRLEGYWRPPR